MFQIGQFIRLINNIKNGEAFKRVTLNKVYKVYGVAGPNNDYVIIERDDGEKVNYVANRFVLAKQPGVFEPGDKVVVRNLDVLKLWRDRYDDVPIYPGAAQKSKNPTMAERMLAYAGKEFTVKDAELHGCVRFVEDATYIWAYGWLDHVQEAVVTALKVGDKVCVVRKGADGVQPRWLAKQDKAIGRQRTIKEIHKAYLVLSDGMAYQFASVVLWDAKKHAIIKAKSLRSVVAEARKTAKPSGLCSFTMIRPGSKKSPDPKIVHRMSAPCHAALNNGIYDSDTYLIGVEYLIDWVGYHVKKFKEADQKVYKKWVEYITHESPWAPAYVQKETRNILKNGADMNIEVTGNLIASACIAMRMGNEYPNQNKAWGEWKALGYNGNVAFLMAYTFGSPNAKTIQLQSMSGGHSVLSAELNAAALLSLFRNGYNDDQINPEEKETYRKNARYTVHKIIDCTNIDERFKDVRGNLRTFVNAVVPMTVDGTGWAAVTKYKKADVVAFANFLQKEFTK